MPKKIAIGREEVKSMIKGFAVGILTLVVAFFVGAVVVNAQTTTTSPTATPTMSQSATTTPGAPQTGFGN